MRTVGKYDFPYSRFCVCEHFVICSFFFRVSAFPLHFFPPECLLFFVWEVGIVKFEV